MDDRKPAIPPDELSLRSASGRPSAGVETPPAALTESHGPVAPERHSRAAQIEPCQTDSPDGDSVVVYYGSEEDVARGFLMALRAMGVTGIEQPPKRLKAPLGRAMP
jgi:hypothetical protein